MKKNFILILTAIIISQFISCTSVQPMSESTKQFIQETGLSLAPPLRAYTWIKVENANKVQPDIFSGKLDFKYDASGDFLLKIAEQDNGIMSVWGNQLLLQDGSCRYFILTAFISAIYKLKTNTDPLDISFEVLRQILADEAYKSDEKELIGLFQEGIQKYRIGGNEWKKYKDENFIIDDKTIYIKTKSYAKDIDPKMYDKIIMALKEDQLDSRERVFSNLPGSDNFIKMFNLNSLEVEMIGDWYKFSSTPVRKDNEYGAGISMTFLPNRIFIARSQNHTYDERGILKSLEEIVKMGYWKVENGELKIQLKQMYVLTRTHNPNQGSTEKTQKFGTPYYSIWRPELYEEGAVQKEPFYYHKIPENIRIMYDIDIIDYKRQRSLTAIEYDPSRNDIYTAAKPWYNFLISPDLEDDTYIYYLRNIVTINGLGNKAAHAYLQLDFSKWN